MESAVLYYRKHPLDADPILRTYYKKATGHVHFPVVLLNEFDAAGLRVKKYWKHGLDDVKKIASILSKDSRCPGSSKSSFEDILEDSFLGDISIIKEKYSKWLKKVDRDIRSDKLKLATSFYCDVPYLDSQKMRNLFRAFYGVFTEDMAKRIYQESSPYDSSYYSDTGVRIKTTEIPESITLSDGFKVNPTYGVRIKLVVNSYGAKKAFDEGTSSSTFKDGMYDFSMLEIYVMDPFAKKMVQRHPDIIIDKDGTVSSNHMGLSAISLIDAFAHHGFTEEIGRLFSSCCICNKPLTDPQSILKGMGPVCSIKYQGMQEAWKKSAANINSSTILYNSTDLSLEDWKRQMVRNISNFDVSIAPPRPEDSILIDKYKQSFFKLEDFSSESQLKDTPLDVLKDHPEAIDVILTHLIGTDSYSNLTEVEKKDWVSALLEMTLEVSEKKTVKEVYNKKVPFHLIKVLKLMDFMGIYSKSHRFIRYLDNIMLQDHFIMKTPVKTIVLVAEACRKWREETLDGMTLSKRFAKKRKVC
jgi:Family of unknown function (DUF6011)